MEAANKGAGTDASFGVNIRLPFENGANEYLSPGKVINFKYFFTRKVQFVKESDAFALFPGGWGTMDEAFESATLMQTDKIFDFPVVFVGRDYWAPLFDFLQQRMLKEQTISRADFDQLVLTDAVEAGVAFVPGSAFAVDRDLTDHLRLSIATVAADQLPVAVERLAQVVQPG